jgi:CubicO group peptidase (beta-lactamase class C family)
MIRFEKGGLVMEKQVIKKTFVFFLSLIMAFAILYSGTAKAQSKQKDYWPTQGWRIATPESQGVDSQKLVNMLDLIWEREYRVDSVLVIRNGYLVLEAYGYPYNAGLEHNLYSCSKSIISALVGIAIDKGYIKGVNQPLLEFFPERVAENLDANKKAMTLEHVLMMATGLECRDSYRYGWRGLFKMRLSDDWVKYVMDLPMAEAPGNRFEYCNSATFLLSAILQKQTGMTAFSFAKKHLFGPLGISDVRWPSNQQGITMGFSELHMQPRDMAKIGYLYMNNGLWEGKQIVSSQWVKASTRKQISATLADGYGYQWWIVDPTIYTAIGFRGQHIFVVSEKDLVVVFTSSLPPGNFIVPRDLLKGYIIPAVKSSTVLPGNPKGGEALKALTIKLQNRDRLYGKESIKKVEKSRQVLKMEEYVNKDFGFSAKYDAQVLNLDTRLFTPVVFSKRGVGGLPSFSVVAGDIPWGWALKDTGDFFVNEFKKMFPKTTDHNLYKQELIKLSDETEANYFEMSWRSQSMELLIVGVFAYKNNKMIGIVTAGRQGESIEYLASMVKSLTFKK